MKCPKCKKEFISQDLTRTTIEIFDEQHEDVDSFDTECGDNYSFDATKVVETKCPFCQQELSIEVMVDVYSEMGTYTYDNDYGYSKEETEEDDLSTPTPTCLNGERHSWKQIGHKGDLPLLQCTKCKALRTANV